MGKIKCFAALFCAVMCASALSLTSVAADVNLGEWNTVSTLYEVLDYSTESNCSVEYAFLKVKYDRPSNRIKLLFMLDLTSFADEEKAGVTMSVNGDEKITLHLDGKSEYNEDKYFAEIKSASDPRSKTLFLEVTLGIKQGIPESVILDFNVYDTDGVASNTYTVDISEKEEASETESQAEATKNTSAKPAKTKTTKTKAAKTSASTEQDVPGQTNESAPDTLENNNHNSGTRVNEKNLIATVAAVALAAGCIGAGGVHFFRNKKN